VATGTSGRAVVARATATSGSAYGILAETDSSSGVGAFVHARSTTGSPIGIQVLHDAAFGNGIQVETTATGGSATGLSLRIRGPGATGAFVRADGINASGVRVDCAGAQSSGVVASGGVVGVAGSASGLGGAGVQGAATDPSGVGLRGLAVASTGTNYGVLGEAKSTAGYGVFSRGRFGATGSKGFVQPHPTDPKRQIFFVCLEGNENGTYFRGSARLEGGQVAIPIPEAWRLVTEPEGITVQVTPIGRATLWIEAKGLDRIVIGGDHDVEFDYFVNGIRRGFRDFKPIEPNRAFVPTVRDRPFLPGHPEGFRRLLIENGILNPDGTPCESTAARLGWRLDDAPSTRSRAGKKGGE
jgi:hypothetical protein